MRRFFCADIPEPGKDARLDPAESRHAVRVLRLRAGDAVVLADGAGGVAEGKIGVAPQGGHQSHVMVRVLRRRHFPLPEPGLYLYVSPPRAKIMTGIIRQATELGVRGIVPVLCARGVSKPGKIRPRDHWRKEAVAAIKQSGNPYLPELNDWCSFDDALSGCGVAGVYGSHDVGAATLPARLPAELAVWIGPEGGFTPDETSSLEQAGMQPVQIGHWTLRVETAVTALLGWLLGTWACHPRDADGKSVRLS